MSFFCLFCFGESLYGDALSIDDPLFSRCWSSVCHEIPAITDRGFLTTCYRRYNFTKTKREKKQGFENYYRFPVITGPVISGFHCNVDFINSLDQAFDHKNIIYDSDEKFTIKQVCQPVSLSWRDNYLNNWDKRI